MKLRPAVDTAYGFRHASVARIRGRNYESCPGGAGHDPCQDIYLEGFCHQCPDALFQVLKVRGCYVLIERSLAFPCFVEIEVAHSSLTS